MAERVGQKIKMLSIDELLGVPEEKGVTEIEDIYHIERGYEDFESKLRALGADIVKKNVPGSAVRKAVL